MASLVKLDQTSRPIGNPAVDLCALWPYHYGMKETSIKVTYSLDAATVMEVQELAVAWRMPKSEVIRRSVHAAHTRRDALAPGATTPEAALAILQATPRLTAKRAESWIQAVRDERRQSRRS